MRNTRCAEPARLLRRTHQGKNSKAESIFVFYPGAAACSSQSVRAGRHQGADPALYGFTIDELSLPLQKENAIGGARRAAVGQRFAVSREQEVREDYRKKYTGLRPTFYGAQSYDAAQLINGAVVAVKGDTAKKDEMKAEMEKANFKSVRGPFKYGKNHIPIQNFYLQDVVKDFYVLLSLKTVATIVKDDQDRFHDKCPMK